MNKQNVKQIIQELVKQNFNLYPESFEIVNGLSTDDATMTVQDIAADYYEMRNEHEIERDEKLGITKIDYVDWCMAEYEIYVQSKINS